MKITSAVSIVSIVFLLAACDSQSGLDPVVAQEVALARVDPDAALAEKVEKALGVDSAPLSYGVEVTASGGKVELWGTVDSSAARKRMEVTAAGVVGVKSLVNHLKVDPGA
jgi:osmotically-inducible protein OsmY